MPKLPTYCPNDFTLLDYDGRCSMCSHKGKASQNSPPPFGPGYYAFAPNLGSAKRALGAAISSGWPVTQIIPINPSASTSRCVDLVGQFWVYAGAQGVPLTLFYDPVEGIQLAVKPTHSSCVECTWDDLMQALQHPPAPRSLSQSLNLNKLTWFAGDQRRELKSGDFVYDIVTCQPMIVSNTKLSSREMEKFMVLCQCSRGRYFNRVPQQLIPLQLKYNSPVGNESWLMYLQWVEPLETIIKVLLKQQTKQQPIINNNNNEVSRSTEDTRNGEGTTQAVYVSGCENQIAVGVNYSGDPICYRGDQAAIRTDEGHISAQPTRIG